MTRFNMGPWTEDVSGCTDDGSGRDPHAAELHANELRAARAAALAQQLATDAAHAARELRVHMARRLGGAAVRYALEAAGDARWRSWQQYT